MTIRTMPEREYSAMFTVFTNDQWRELYCVMLEHTKALKFKGQDESHTFKSLRKRIKSLCAQAQV